ncbi:MAG: DUF5663 domain-containing protein [Candidatus Uhrbacteria bacterium]|nr:DUF5663 domain-containing protein [Candidatus Uhrbacteria bacterium]
MENTNVLEVFVERLLEEKGLANVEPNVLAEMRQDLLERVGERINAEMLAALAPDKVEQLNEMLDGDQSDEQIREFFFANVPNFQEVLTTAIMNFRSAYLG